MLEVLRAGPSLLTMLAETLLDYDEAVGHWRHRHVLAVERQIGLKPGTGGSSGAAYLRSTLTRRFFPELWEARTALWPGGGGEGGGGGGGGGKKGGRGAETGGESGGPC